MKFLLIFISCGLLLPNFFHIQLEKTPVYDHKEEFNPNLAYLNSIQKLTTAADSIAVQKNVSQNSLQYAIIVTNLVRNRFYHGFSKYPLTTNWIAAGSDYLFGYGLAAIVAPDDILKYSHAGCSQQSIVLMEVMKRKNISSRIVGFPHHFATELCFNNSWYFFDPNMEPHIKDSDRLESKWNCCADSLKKYYDTSRYKNLDWVFGNSSPLFGKVNAAPAPNAAVFQSTTNYLSKIMWLFPLIIIFYRNEKVRRSSK